MIFRLVMLGIWAMLYGYVGWRTIRPARLARSMKLGLWAMLAGLWPLPLLALLLRGTTAEGPWLDLLTWCAFLTLGFFVLSFCLLAVADLTRLTLRLLRGAVRVVRPAPRGAGANPSPPNPSRRRFLAHSANLGLLGVAGGLAGYGLSETLQAPALVAVKVRLPHLPPALEGFRIVQLTDIHLGPMIKQRFLAEVVERTNALEPDLIALTGDLVDGSVPQLRAIASPLSSLAARQGTFFVTGNHEYYAGVQPWLDELDRLGLRLLLNGHRVLQRGGARLLVAGVTDPNGERYLAGHRPDLATAVAGAEAADVKLLLAHQPRAIYDAARHDFDLQLSGHTHGGQFIPWNYVVSLTQPYIAGLHLHQGTWIYVSKGTGFWGPPLRLGTQAEITLLELTAQPAPPTA